MAFTHKTKPPPTCDMAAITKRLSTGQPLTTTQATQWVAWKQWVESTNAYDGVAKGGIRDVFDADMEGVDALKGNVDIHGQRLNTHAAEIDQLKAWVAAQPRPFP